MSAGLAVGSHTEAVAALPEPVKDLFHELVELVGDVFGDVLGEALLGLAAIGLGCLAWWGFQRARI